MSRVPVPVPVPEGVTVSQEVWDALPSQERLNLWRSQTHPVEKRQRPQYRDLTPAEVAELDKLGLSPTERLTRGREVQQHPDPGAEQAQ